VCVRHEPPGPNSYARLRIPGCRDTLYDVIRKEAWSFYKTIFDVRLCWELEEPEGPKKRPTCTPDCQLGRLRSEISPKKASKLSFEAVLQLEETEDATLILKTESGPLSAVNLSHHKWPGMSGPLSKTLFFSQICPAGILCSRSPVLDTQ